jgi:hypothetical protein
MEFIEMLLAIAAIFAVIGAPAIWLSNRREARQQRADAHATSICGQCWASGAIIPLCAAGATRHAACTRHAAATTPKEVA